MTPTELHAVASDLQAAVDLLQGVHGDAPTSATTREARTRAEAVVSRLLEASAAEERRAFQAAPEEPGVRDLDAEPPGPLPDAVRALERARTHLREELDAVAEWKDAAQLVPYLAGVLAEVLPAAVHASAELPAAATTRAYWDAYLTGDPEPDVDPFAGIPFMDPYLSPPDEPV